MQWVAVGSACRIGLHFLGVSSAFDRLETNVVSASLHELREGAFLWQSLRSSLYSGAVVSSSVHFAPVVLSVLQFVPPHFIWLLSVVADVFSALALTHLSQSALLSVSNAALYALNPLAIASCLSGSPASWAAALLLWSVVFASGKKKSGFLCGLLLGLFVTLQPRLLFFVPAVLFSCPSASFSFLSTVIALVSASTLLCGGSAAWVFDVWGFVFDSRDVTPNLGLHWYFFMELFVPFRMLYERVWFAAIITPLLAIAFYVRRNVVVSVACCGLLFCVLSPRPSISEVALVHTLMMFTPGNGKYFLFPAWFAFVLMGIFSNFWLYLGSGNANFFYASTLVAAATHVVVLLMTLNKHREEEHSQRRSEKKKKQA